MRCVSLLLRWRHRENELEGVQSDLNRIDSRKRSVPSKALPFSQVQSVRLDWGSNLGATIKGLMIELKLDLNLNNQHGSLSQVHWQEQSWAISRCSRPKGYNWILVDAADATDRREPLEMVEIGLEAVDVEES